MFHISENRKRLKHKTNLTRFENFYKIKSHYNIHIVGYLIKYSNIVAMVYALLYTLGISTLLYN